MLTNPNRNKLLNAVVYFAANTRFCGKVKLFKLLYLLDFSHFRETGRSVTGLDYLAWRLGPVPLDLAQEWEQLQPDLAAVVEIIPERVINYTRELVVAKAAFDDSQFSRRELRLMEQLASLHRDEMTRPLVSFTHAERGPWDTIWDNGRGANERIPYRLAIADDNPNRDAILEAAQEYEAIAAANSRPH